MNTTDKNPLIDQLIRMGISSPSSLKPYHPRTRDNDDIKVLKCSKSGVIVLEKLVTSEQYYTSNNHYHTDKQGEVLTAQGSIKSEPLEDDIRRFETYKAMIKGKRLLDFGCGSGGFLSLSNEISDSCTGIELESTNRNNINKSGIECVQTIEQLSGKQFDLIFLNHVLEHLPHPISVLKSLHTLLEKDGKLIIEVPHSKDILIQTFDLDAFKDFTFWSEHLILHTRKSLKIFLNESGFDPIEITGFQRYPLSNHFNWLLNGQPSGHTIYKHLNNDLFNRNYGSFLDKIDETDTLIGYFRKHQ